MFHIVWKKSWRRELLPLAIVFLMFAIGFYAEPLVKTNEQGQIAIHFNAWGQADGWMDKAVAVYLFPIVSLIIYAGLLVIPKIEVYQHNLEEFALHFWGFKVILVFVLAVIYIALLLPNMESWAKFDPLVIVIPAVSLLFFYVGYMLNFTKRNYFIGVRTPWTLADERVWEKTNRLTGALFWVCGVLTLVSLMATADLRLWLVILPLVITAIFGFFYSLWEYRKVRHAGAKRKGGKRG
ncbi:MAG: SdpI family protein [Candidatus Micrarchaeota archaeon]|nr:SdpI family protein [Candidatus Micrarchaeota archaeon]